MASSRATLRLDHRTDDLLGVSRGAPKVPPLLMEAHNAAKRRRFDPDQLHHFPPAWRLLEPRCASTTEPTTSWGFQGGRRRCPPCSWKRVTPRSGVGSIPISSTISYPHGVFSSHAAPRPQNRRPPGGFKGGAEGAPLAHGSA